MSNFQNIKIQKLKTDVYSDIMHIAYPYRSGKNWAVNNSSYRVYDQETEIDFAAFNFKLLTFNILNNIDAVQVEVTQNDCMFMTYFFSTKENFVVDIFKDQGNSVNLYLSDAAHDYNKHLIEAAKDELAVDTKVDMTDRLYQFRMENNLFNEHVQLNFFCPYWFEGQIEADFIGKINFIFNGVEKVKDETNINTSTTDPTTIQNTPPFTPTITPQNTPPFTPPITSQNTPRTNPQTNPETNSNQNTDPTNNPTVTNENKTENAMTMDQSMNLFTSLKNDDPKEFLENMDDLLTKDERVKKEEITMTTTTTEILEVNLIWEIIRGNKVYTGIGDDY